MLDEFGPHNGATRVLPGTHLTGRTSSVLADATAPQPGDTLVQGPQGSVCVFSSHLFHGGTLNTTDKHRNAMHGFFTRRCFSQQVDQQKALKAKTWKRLQTSPTGTIATAILDVMDPGSPKL
jgi:ectoine hydroxylase-related dioxygenase (phytanoyl-CoA dioxygenase family)